MYTRVSCFNTPHKGLSCYAGVKSTPAKNRVFDKNSINSAIKLQQAENRRELIYALANA